MTVTQDDPFGEESPASTASAGRRFTPPPTPPSPVWPDTMAQDSGDAIDDTPDYTDLETVNRDLLHLRIRLNRIRRAMRDASREAADAKIRYQRAYRRALVQQSGGSAETRKASAELLCEELEADVMVKQQVADEYQSLFRAIRDDVENAKAVAYNLRSLMSL